MSAYAKRLWVSPHAVMTQTNRPPTFMLLWFQLEEDLGDDYRWSYRVSAVLFSGRSPYQEVDLVETPTWGKVNFEIVS